MEDHSFNNDVSANPDRCARQRVEGVFLHRITALVVLYELL